MVASKSIWKTHPALQCLLYSPTQLQISSPSPTSIDISWTSPWPKMIPPLKSSNILLTGSIRPQHLQREHGPLTPCPQTPSLQNYETTGCSCLSHSAVVLCYGGSSELAHSCTSIWGQIFLTCFNQNNALQSDRNSQADTRLQYLLWCQTAKTFVRIRNKATLLTKYFCFVK